MHTTATRAHGQLELDMLNALSACAKLSRAGCTLLSAHIHAGLPVIVVDRRPALSDLQPRGLRSDRRGADYHAELHGIKVAWHEPATRINMESAA